MKIMAYINQVLEILSDYGYKLRYHNRPYIEYYRAVMRRETKKDSERAVGMAGKGVGERQLERLKIYGLKPEHTLFDFGCGRLRGGIPIIKYLAAGHYTGNDISQDILEVAKKRLYEAGLQSKRPRLFYTDDLAFSEFTGETFDYIHAQSVLSHMPPRDIEELFKNVSSIMHKETQFIASYFPSKTGAIYSSVRERDFHYPFLWMKETGMNYGLRIEQVEDVPGYSGKQPIIRIMLA